MEISVEYFNLKGHGPLWDRADLDGPGARFSKVPVTFRARNQIFKSKYKE